MIEVGRLREVVDALPDSSLVLDVGGWVWPDPRADWVIDVGPFETRGTFGRGEREPWLGSDRLAPERWVQRDVCNPEPWPFPDGMFDFVICAQTLEDVRDPIRVCREMTRVGKAGCTEVPGAGVELTRGVESPLWCGWRHHRWLVEEDGGGGLLFFPKPHHIHHRLWPSIPSPRLLLPGTRVLWFLWEGPFAAAELIVHGGEEFDARLQAIVRRSSRPAPAAALRRAAAASVWNGYRLARGAAGRVARR